MSPILLLVVFAGLAISAFTAFAILAYSESTPRREDWKKFLSSFAGTALGLSVGFISLMLQQQSQSTLTTKNEEKEIQRKLRDENAQIKARLLYSIMQKKFETVLFLDIPSKDKTFEEMCNPSADKAARDRNFQDFKSKNFPAEDLQDMKQMITQLFSSNAYERSVLSRIMKETSFPARIPPEMSSVFLDRELELYVRTPPFVAQLFELFATEAVDTFCTRLSKIHNTRGSLVRTIVDLQMSTCGAFATIGTTTADEGIEKARALHKLLEMFVPTSSTDVDGFVGNLPPELHDVARDFKSCMASADIPFRQMFAKPD